MPRSFAETALAAIEFPAALKCVSHHAVTAQGAARISALRPITDISLIASQLGRVDAMRRLMDDGADVTPLACGEPESALARLAVEGSVLEGADLVAIQSLLEALRLTGQKLRRAAQREPSLTHLERPELPRDLEAALARALDPDGGVKDEASRDLQRVRRELISARSELVRTLERIFGSLDPRHRGEGSGVTLRGGRYVIPVRTTGRGKLGGIVHDESATHATLFVEPPEAIELNNTLRALEAEEAREVQRVLRELTGLLRPHSDAIEYALDGLIEADSCWARARFASERHAVRPDVVSRPAALALRGAAHPLLFQEGAVVVRFDFVLEGTERTVLVSGPNTGGKTVFVKAVGLVVALAQCGVIPPLGAGSVIPVFDSLFADIGDRQSIAESLSTFSAHVANLREVLESAGAGSLVLLDELGTGTDPAEGAALAAAALVALTERGAHTLATTHLGALKDLASQTPGIVNASLQFDAATLGPTYRFVKGVPGRSYGLAIARRLGIDPLILADAEGRIGATERRLDAMLAATEARGQELEKRGEALGLLQLEAENLAARLELREQRQREQEDDLAAREKAFERRGRTGMRDFLLEARAEVERAVALAREGREKEARRAIEAQISELAREESGQWGGDAAGSADSPAGAAAGPPLPESAVIPGASVRIRSLGLDGTVESVQGDDVAILVRGRRVRVRLHDLGAPPAGAKGPAR